MKLAWIVPSVVALSVTGCGGCDKYASAYSCSCVEDRADYDVYYWQRVEEDNEDDNRIIGNVVGLRACRDAAIKYSAHVGEAWDERAYICVLKKDGVPMEKHRAQ
jgi:hypothetical protein